MIAAPMRSRSFSLSLVTTLAVCALASTASAQPTRPTAPPPTRPTVPTRPATPPPTQPTAPTATADAGVPRNVITWRVQSVTPDARRARVEELLRASDGEFATGYAEAVRAGARATGTFTLRLEVRQHQWAASQASAVHPELNAVMLRAMNVIRGRPAPIELANTAATVLFTCGPAPVETRPATAPTSPAPAAPARPAPTPARPTVTPPARPQTPSNG